MKNPEASLKLSCDTHETCFKPKYLNMRARVYARCARVHAQIFTKMSLSLKFRKDLYFRYNHAYLISHPEL